MKRTIVYKYSNYRLAFAELFRQAKDIKEGAFKLATLANSVGIQPSYITNVAKERAHFSADQIHAIGEELGLNMTECEFLCLLMEEERSTNPRRRGRLKEQLAKLKNKHLRADKVLQSPSTSMSEEAKERYYLDAHIELIHLFLGTTNAPQKVSELAQIWGLSEEHVADILSFLHKQNLIRQRYGRWEREKISQHLPRESTLARSSQFMKRMKALDTLQRLPVDVAYTFTATTTMSEATKTEIQGLFLEFLKNCEKSVKSSEPENVYQIQFDLFPWILPR